MNLTVERVAALLLVAAFVAMLARRFRLPYTAGLVLAGVVLAIFPVAANLTLTKDLVFTVLLPPLVFEAAFESDEPFRILVANSHAGGADDLIGVRRLRAPRPTSFVKQGPAFTTDSRFFKFPGQLVGVVLILLDGPIMSSSQACRCLPFLLS